MQAQPCELVQCWHYFHVDADGAEGSCAPDLCSGVSVFCLAHPTLEYAGRRLVTSTPFPGGIWRLEQVSALAKAVELVGDRHSLHPACGPSKPRPRGA